VGRLLVTIEGNPWAGRVNVRTGMAWSSRRREAKAYLEQVRLAALQARRAQRVAYGAQRVEVWLTLYVPDLRRRDVDGPVKAILDGLTAAGVWADDAHVWTLHVRKALGRPRAVVVVAPLTAPDPAC
jgi:Holliday junction resolvase RusA-like endonuclease